MASPLRAGVCSLLACVAASARVKKSGFEDADLQRAGSEAPNVDSVACPVLAALVKRGIAKEDSYGRVSQNQITYALTQTGNTQLMAVFQSKAIAGFATPDIHQNDRIKFSNDTDRWLNFRNMNRQDYCHRGGPDLLGGGIPCNANIEFQQHGYSTLLRDPEGGLSAEQRFVIWFYKQGVLTYIPGLGRVMTLEGLGILLKSARLTGDHSSEFSTNQDGSLAGSPMEFSHPSIVAPFNVSAVSTWQAVTAWSSFWAAFAHEEEGGYPAHMTVDELKTWFIDGDFPADYTMKPWGFRETFAIVAALGGSGAGDEWCTVIEGSLNRVGWDAGEQTYFYEMIESIGSIGAREDDIQRSYPPGRD